MDLKEVEDRLSQVDKKVAAAVEAVDSDGEASPALRAVMKEFGRKTQRTLEDLDDAEEPLREHIVEVEQAGDSARRAADAEERIGDSTRRLVLDAHAAICSLKAETKV